MEALGQIQQVANKIRTSSRPAVYALYRLVFEEEGNRASRKRLREFRGFDFNDASQEFKTKYKYSAVFTIGDLTSMCNILGLDYTGTKEDLRQKIIRALMDIQSLAPHEDDDVDSGEESEESERAEELPHRLQTKMRASSDIDASSHSNNDSYQIPRKHRRQDRTKITFNFKDIEDTIRPFDGSDDCPIEKWIANFEELAALFKWDAIQKLVFVRKSLKGVAKTFVRGLSITQSWKQLKEALKEEFSLKVSSADIHRKLAKRKIKKDENLQEYYLSMREIASKGNIDVESVIQYIIDGVPDNSNKVVLYGARNYNEFKARLRTYERMQDRGTASSKGYLKKETMGKPTKDDAKSEKDDAKRTAKDRCYNCGEGGHRSTTCQFKDRGKKCFGCNDFGHETKNCPSKNSKKSQVTTNVLVQSVDTSRMFKEIVIGDNCLRALIDTGSHLSLMRENMFTTINISKLCKSHVLLTDIAQGQVKTLGYFQTTIIIDNVDFSITFYVVPSGALTVDIILGTDFINQTEITINQDGIKITKPNALVLLSQIELQQNNDELIHTDLNIDNESRKTVECMMSAYKPNKIKTTDIELKITLKEETPIYQSPRRLPPKERESVEKQVNDWLHEGIIEPCSSEYASPVVVVKKKNGSLRLCVDYRKLNRIMVRDKYPLPVMDEQIDLLTEANIFSTIDLENAFLHVNVEASSRKYTAFVTHQDH
ncbi:uncharacterized protein LOC105204179 [Solenopsis invicta]|uniref:uncharacterized protein LOC105204179 n=1 Tax=Solenopsis invicta TaxID=13686 RepID=UPI000595C4DE|nr:uncharacterized protein LOC105204179 [Solenopsis invicta]